jgi:two-component system chemotaxis response regulator CheB
MSLIRTLIVDDTVMYRKVLADAAKRFSQLEVLGTAPSGTLALKKLEQNGADLVLLDVHMPDMDGVETLQQIRSRFPKTLVVMVSGVSSRSTAITVKALELGAIDFVQKPEGSDFAAAMDMLYTSLQPVVRTVEMRLALATPRTIPLPAREPSAPPLLPAGRPSVVPRSFGVVTIGVSTGGPEALGVLIPRLPASLPVPVVLVQHMPPLFTRSLAESLDRKSPLTVKEAEEGEVLRVGTVYIAPGGHHTMVRRTDGGVVIKLSDSPPENSCRPAVDVLFRSVADSYGDTGVLAVVLTGMGSDGASGVRALKRQGCYCITQSSSSCVVYGMPRAVDEAGLSDKSLPIEQIGGEIAARFGIH